MSSIRRIWTLACLVVAVRSGFGNPPDWRGSLQSGVTEHSLGHFAQAEVLLRDALDGSRKFGKKTEIADTLSHLGDVYLSEDRLTEAEHAYAEGLSLYKEASSGEIGAVVTLRNLGTVFAQEGRNEKALPILTEALRQAKINGHNDPQLTAEILNSIGIVYFNRHNFKKAEARFLEVIRMRSQTGADDFVTASAFNNLAHIHREARKYLDAEREYRHSLEITDKLLGPSHPDVAITRCSLGVLYMRMGRLEDAEQQVLESLRITAQTNPVIPGRVVRTLRILSEVYVHQGNAIQAEVALARAVGIARQNSERDVETATVLDAYSAILKRLGKVEEARTTHIEADRVRATMALIAPMHGPR